MSRPLKFRNIEFTPKHRIFGPLNLNADNTEAIILNEDELEVIRLIDLEKLTQEEASKKIKTSRTTVQNLYAQAREKIAQSLINQKILFLGNIKCHRRRCQKIKEFNQKGEIMDNKIIALAVNEKNLNGELSNTFGRAKYFLIMNLQTNEHKFVENLANNDAHGTGVKASQILIDNKAEVLITKKLGQNAAKLLNAANIKIYKNSSDDIKTNIENLKAKKLEILNEFQSSKKDLNK